MKRISALLLCLAPFFMIACQKEEAQPSKKTGILHIDVGVFFNVNELNSLLKSTPVAGDLKVIIYKSDGTGIISFDHASDMPEVIEIETGDYYVEAFSDNNHPAEFENPYYYGLSEVFTIISNSQQTVVLNCGLANTMVSVVYSDNITSRFSDYSTTVSTATGSLIFSKDETRMGYFQTLPFEILVELTYLKSDGTPITKTLSGTIPEPLAGRHYEIVVDASSDEGKATFQILLDDTEVLTEIVEITDGSNNQPTGSVLYGELLISEIMPNPSALSDTEGEFFEIYNHSDHMISLQNLILGRDDASMHTITDPIELAPGAYFVFTRTNLATDATNSYVYGSDILLPNTGAVLSIYNEGTETSPGSLIFSVDYGGDGFPELTGASVSLGPDRLNAADAISGSFWCASTSVYSSGDFGTPGKENDPCQ